jgi:hypothetical protein
MRRRLIWIAGMTGIGSALALTLIAAAVNPEPFAFLRGKDPLDTPNLRQRAHHCATQGLECLTYSFRGPAGSSLEAIQKELVHDGFVQFGTGFDPQELIYFKPHPLSRRIYPDGTEEKQQMVTVLTNHRYQADRVGAYDVSEPHTDKGWITISIRREQPQSIIGRLREWIGL